MALEYPNSYPDSTIVDTYFGNQVHDPYRWLEDDFSDSTTAWVKQQNALTDSFIQAIPYRNAFRERLEQIWNYEKFGTPFKKAGKLYYFYNSGTQNQSALYQLVPGGTDSLILDPNTFSEDGTTALGALSISKDGNYLAYSISQVGSDWNTIKILNLQSGETLTEEINWVKFSGIAWHKNGFYYSRYPGEADGNEYSKANEYMKVCYHSVGTDPAEDAVVYENPNEPNRNYYAQTTQDEDFLIISESASTSGNNIFVHSLINPKVKFSIERNFEADFAVIGSTQNEVYLLTNYNAPNYRLIAVQANSPEESNWREVIAERTERLETVKFHNGNLIAQYLKDVTNELEVVDLQGKLLETIPLPELGVVGSISCSNNDETGYFSFTNYTLPTTIYKFNKHYEYQLFKQPKLDFDFENYESKRVFYTSKDGTKIPLFITHKKGIQLDGTNPTWLYGYGGFDISVKPAFSTNMAFFMEQGGIYAVANIRGGGEYGEAWHKAGMQLNKQNVFDDFIAAAEFLIDNKYTSSSKLAIHGRSNGGLLVGACLTQRPDLFKVALPGVGVLDMLRYHKFTIGWAWASDYGRSDDSTQIQNLLSYSPVHNIKPVEYPSTLVLTGDHDDRVVPAHSFKFAATLQANQQGNQPALIRIDINAGHGAGKPLSKTLDEWADIFAFTAHELNMNPSTTTKH